MRFWEFIDMMKLISFAWFSSGVNFISHSKQWEFSAHDPCDRVPWTQSGFKEGVRASVQLGQNVPHEPAHMHKSACSCRFAPPMNQCSVSVCYCLWCLC